MLTKLKLQNFRGFKEHEVPLRERTVIVGANNTGKSTIIEALRLVSLVTNRYRALTYAKPPKEVNIPTALDVVSPSLKGITVNFDNMFHNLGDPPGVIEATFSGGELVQVYVTSGRRVFAGIRDSEGRSVRNRAEANVVKLPEVHILPQVGPLARDEVVKDDSYVLSNLSTDISYLHFRNQLRLMTNYYARFSSIAASTWPGLRIKELVGGKALPGEPLGLLVQDGDFVAEASWMGHGLQVWLQAMWFMARTPKAATVVLDEPDVYLHPDRQRRLVRLMHSSFSQFIMATHSIEIMSEVEPSEILVIDRNVQRSRFADDEPTVQRLVDHIGSVHNINLARLAAAKRLLIVEGDDLDVLGQLHRIVFPMAEYRLAGIPHLPLGGWGGWDYAVGSKLTLGNYVGDKVRIYCMFDRDYHTPAQIRRRYLQANARGIELHIWMRKELENYLIVPSLLARVIESRIGAGKKGPSVEQVSSELDGICERLKQEITAGLGTEFESDDRRGGFAAAMSNAQKLVGSAWASREGRWTIASGKRVLSALSGWAQKKYGVSFGTMTLARNMRVDEIPAEVVEVLRAIERSEGFAEVRRR